MGNDSECTHWITPYFPGLWTIFVNWGQHRRSVRGQGYSEISSRLGTLYNGRPLPPATHGDAANFSAVAHSDSPDVPLLTPDELLSINHQNLVIIINLWNDSGWITQIGKYCVQAQLLPVIQKEWSPYILCLPTTSPKFTKWMASQVEQVKPNIWAGKLHKLNRLS